MTFRKRLLGRFFVGHRLDRSEQVDTMPKLEGLKKGLRQGGRVVVFALLAVGGSAAAEQTITLDGNFLFYNAPVTQTGPSGHEYVAYMSRWGGYTWPASRSRVTRCDF